MSNEENWSRVTEAANGFIIQAKLADHPSQWSAPMFVEHAVQPQHTRDDIAVERTAKRLEALIIDVSKRFEANEQRVELLVQTLEKSVDDAVTRQITPHMMALGAELNASVQPLLAKAKALSPDAVAASLADVITKKLAALRSELLEQIGSRPTMVQVEQRIHERVSALHDRVDTLGETWEAFSESVLLSLRSLITDLDDVIETISHSWLARTAAQLRKAIDDFKASR